MMGTGWLSSEDAVLLSAWVGSLLFVLFLSLGVLFFPKPSEKFQRFFFPLLIFPSFVVLIVYMFRGFSALSRPVVHWVFRKEVQDSLHIGVFFDSMTLIVTLTLGLVLLVTCLRNRPQIHVISAMSLSWVAVAIVASSKTFWTAAIGLGVAATAKFLPILFDTKKTEIESLDALSVTASKRAWIGLLVTLTGAAGLASQGHRLDFFSEAPWTAYLESPKSVIAGTLFLIGLLIQFVPVITSSVLHKKWTGHLEEENFIFETAGGWISVLILYRILPNLRDTPWAIGLEAGALFLLVLSLLGLAFIESKRGAITFWLANLPLLVLTILPSLLNQTAFLFVAGSVVAFCGLLLCLDHARTRVDLGLAIFFFLGSFGFMGWATSIGIVEIVSKIEEQPILGGSILLIWLLFASFGFRIVLRGGEFGTSEANPPKWVASGLLILLGFGPLLSGRWVGGVIPEMADWVDGSKDWPWVITFVTEGSSVTWLGLGLSQSISLIAILLGIFVATTAPLFPFAGKYPKGLAAAQGLFGGIWIHQKWITILFRTGEFWVNKISGPIWDDVLPRSFKFTFTQFRRLGEFAVERLDVLTSSRVAGLFEAPSKFVQWFHGGNVRLYAWFALGWILIISIYLTR